MGKPRLLLITVVLIGSFLTSVARSSTHTVSMKSMAFSPASISVKVGDTVTWTNDDDRDYNVSSSDGGFSSDNIRPGGSYSFKFTKPGKFSYNCTYHPRMKGTVSVSDK